MEHLYRRIAWRLAFCAVATYVLWRVLGLIALPICAPLWGVALARQILDLIEESRRAVQTLAYADLQGQHYSHRGIVLDIAEDEECRRWVSVRDVRKVLPGFPRDALLKHQSPQDCREDGGRAGLRLRAEALLSYLTKSADPGAVKFKVWLEREVVLPAQMRRERRALCEAPAQPRRAAAR